MADILGVSVTEFLTLTQSYTLPWLVLTKNSAVLSRISQARQDDDPWRAILESSTNFGPIMALLLVQNVPNLDDFIMNLLRDISPHFDALDVDDLLRMDNIHIALELLKNAGEETDSKRSRVYVSMSYTTFKC
jgi:serine/threonine-protein kinase ATR